MKKTFSNEEMWAYIRLASCLHETGRLGFAIAKNTRKFKDEVTEYAAKLDELLIKYGTPVSGKSGRYKISDEKKPLYSAELKEYDGLTSEVDIMQVPEDTFMGGTLTNTQMDTLMWMVEERKE